MIAKMNLFLWRKKGQTASELLICGSLFLMVLGVLVQYGVKHNAQQSLMMESFRDALKEASTDKVAANYLSYQGFYIEDKPIPQVSSPYGLGSLNELSVSSGVTRSYFLHTAEMAKEEAMPRQHFLVKSKDGDSQVFKKREDYDQALGSGKDGFTLAGVKTDIGIIQKSEEVCGQVCDEEDEDDCEDKCVIANFYRVIRTVPDPQDKFPLSTGGDNIYWTWIEIRTTELTPTTNSEGDSINTQVEETIEDILESEIGNIIPPLPSPPIAYGYVLNLGVDLSLNEALSEDDFWKDVIDMSVLSQGARIHPSCLNGVDTSYKVSVIKVFDDKVHVKSSEWAEINTADVGNTKRGLNNQGLQPDKRSETNTRNLQLVNDSSGGSKTVIDQTDKVIRYIKLNSGDIIEIESIRELNKEKYNDSEWQN